MGCSNSKANRTQQSQPVYSQRQAQYAAPPPQRTNAQYVPPPQYRAQQPLPQQQQQLAPLGQSMQGPPPPPMQQQQTVMSITPLGEAPSDPNLKYYVDITGVRRINPNYVKARDAQNQLATTALYPNEALAVCSNMNEHNAYFSNAPVAPSVAATTEIMSDPEMTKRVGLSGDEAMAELGEVFAQFETPMGLVNRLLLLSDFDCLEFIIDDSGSMGIHSPPFASRWKEVESRLKELMRLISCIGCPPIYIHFLNASAVYTIEHQPGEKPKEMCARAQGMIEKIFADHSPCGGTPAWEAISGSLNRHPGKAVSRYFFGDGEPNGGELTKKRITHLLVSRPNPKLNPFTFMSCTEDDAATEWMKEAEEAAPYCGEYDDFRAEAEEVLHDQGPALPYTRGMYMIGQLVGALCPDDLDCLDESVPLSKQTLENVLGYQLQEPEYRRYFDGFLAAQQRANMKSMGGCTPIDRVKQSANWAQYYNDFLAAPLSRHIPAVQDFNQKLKAAKVHF